MPNKNQFPLTGSPRREDITFVIGAVLLVLALFVIISGPVLLMRMGGGIQLPMLSSNVAPQPRVAIFKGANQHADERYIAQPDLPGMSAAPEARVAIFEGTDQHADERYIAQPQVPMP